MEMPPGYPGPTTSRARVMLEVASELVGAEGWEDRHAQVFVGEGRQDSWRLRLMGSSLPEHVHHRVLPGTPRFEPARLVVNTVTRQRALGHEAS